MKTKYDTTFRRIKTNDGAKIVARIWDTYSQMWRRFDSYDDIPVSIKASMTAEERDIIRIKLCK
jgi:hypothetical protein